MNRALHGNPVTRRRLFQGAAAVAATLTIPMAVSNAAHAGTASPSDIAPFDTQQRFVQLIAGGNGVIYGRQADGNLIWYRHTGWATGAATWAAGGGLAIGTGWHTFRTVLATADGQLFARGADGSIRWYQYVVSDPNTGAGSWASGSGQTIGTGFDYPIVFGGPDGVIYGVDTDGALWRYQYLAGNGTNGPAAWANNGAGERIGSGFKPYLTLLAGSDGVITGVRNGNTLDWWRYDASTGAWDNNGAPIQIGSAFGEGNQKTMFTGSNGLLYVVQLDLSATPGEDGALAWYTLTNASTVAQDGQGNWANKGIALTIGSGFTIEPTAAMQGYPNSLSVAQGASVGISVSTAFDGVTAAVNRISGAQRGTVWGPVPIAQGLQLLPAGYRNNSCGWPTSVTVPVAANWSSGVYSLRLTAPSGLTNDVVFFVRPATPAAKVAVMLPTNTYNAYNFWDGHNQYSVGEAGEQRTVTFLRPSTTTGIEAPGRISHTLYHDLFLLNWLDAQGVAYDTYIDSDLDADDSWLGNYQALLLGSHPEYWSATMRQNVVNYLDAGGHLICTGGNAFYEEISFVNGGTAALHRDSQGLHNYFSGLGLPSSQIIGSVWNRASYMDFYPYQVLTDHALLAGTGLSVGDTFGSVAYNGAASGWEVDWLANNPVPSGATQIASGTNPNGGAAMMFLPRNNGGWVFGVSSISFNGALANDPAVSTILSNAINMATS
jgi:hypothetical protein